MKLWRMIRNGFRYFQVKWYVRTGRYIPVPNGVNFYADMKKGGVGVKGYYNKPWSYTTPVFEMPRDEFDRINFTKQIWPPTD